MFMPGSISQIAIGLLGTLISYRIYNFYRPYVEDDDNIVSEVAQTQLVIIFFYALMVYATSNLEEQDGVFSGKVFAWLLVLILVSVLLVTVWLVVITHFGSSGVETYKDRARKRRGTLLNALVSLRTNASWRRRAAPSPKAGDAAGDDAAGDAAGDDDPSVFSSTEARAVLAGASSDVARDRARVVLGDASCEYAIALGLYAAPSAAAS